MAKNTIKGLTVKIGGDTTELGKALDGVNKKGQDLSAELGQINKLLKMDPKNTELLAQKQKVLAEAIKNTGEKLAKLKAAEKSVQEQFKRGEVSEEQVRALQREIIATTQKMEGYSKEADETAKAMKRFGSSTDKAEKSSGSLGETLGNAAKAGFAAVAAAATAALGALVGAAESTREYRTEMGKLDTAFTTSGHSSEAATKTYQELQGILGETDQAVEAANHLAKLTDNEEDLAKWTDIATGVYATFGDSLPIENLTEAANETAKTGKITGGLADALNWAGVSEDDFQASLDACSSEQERQALITETLSGLYSGAADAYKETNAEVIRANKANEAWTASMAEIGASMDPILTDIKLMGASLLTDLLPGITGITDAFRALINGDEGGAAALGTALSDLITQLLDKVVELAPAVVQVATTLITTLTTTLISMIPQLLSTVMTLITTILSGLTQAIPSITQAITDMIPQLVTALVNGIPQMIQGAVQLLLAIMEAIPLVIPPLVDALPQIVISIIDGLAEAIPQLIEGALAFLLAIVEAVPQIIPPLVGALPEIIKKIVDTLIKNIPVLIDAAITLLMAIIDAIPKIIPPLVQALPEIIMGIQSTLLKNIPQLLQAAIKLFSALIQAIPKVIVSLAKELPSIIKAIVTGLGKGVKDIAKVGEDLIKGLWNGIKDMTSWITGKLKSFGETVLGGIKSFFGIASPSKEMAWVGEMLDRGLAKGIEDSAKKPLAAMTDLSSGLLDETNDLNGLTLERKVQHTFAPAASAETGLMGKLDKILTAIERGQILTIDGEQLVGATADMYDNKLGQRRALAVRGAL